MLSYLLGGGQFLPFGSGGFYAILNDGKNV